MLSTKILLIVHYIFTVNLYSKFVQVHPDSVSSSLVLGKPAYRSIQKNVLSSVEDGKPETYFPTERH